MKKTKSSPKRIIPVSVTAEVLKRVGKGWMGTPKFHIYYKVHLVDGEMQIEWVKGLKTLETLSPDAPRIAEELLLKRTVKDRVGVRRPRIWTRITGEPEPGSHKEEDVC